MKFIADVMVGKLARWLRILGQDVVYSNQYADDDIVEVAAREDRIILTRDTRLLERKQARNHLLIESADPDEQVQQVLKAFRIRDYALFSRCLECNRVLEPIDKELAFEQVPPYVYLTQDRFVACPSCQRVYWAGSHTKDVRTRIKSWFT